MSTVGRQGSKAQTYVSIVQTGDLQYQASTRHNNEKLAYTGRAFTRVYVLHTEADPKQETAIQYVQAVVARRGVSLMLIFQKAVRAVTFAAVLRTPHLRFLQQPYCLLQQWPPLLRSLLLLGCLVVGKGVGDLLSSSAAAIRVGGASRSRGRLTPLARPATVVGSIATGAPATAPRRHRPEGLANSARKTPDLMIRA